MKKAVSYVAKCIVTAILLSLVMVCEQATLLVYRTFDSVYHYGK